MMVQENNSDEPTLEETPETTAAPEQELPQPEAGQIAAELEQLTLENQRLEQAILEEKDKYDRLVRAFSEKESLLKREVRLHQEKAKFTLSDFAQELLSVSDNLSFALESAPGDQALQNFVSGIAAIQRQLEMIFERFSLCKMDPLGKPFDPHFHEAMMSVEAPDKPVGSIVQVLQSGYMIHDRLLRAAKVSVVKDSLSVDSVPSELKPGEGISAQSEVLEVPSDLELTADEGVQSDESGAEQFTEEPLTSAESDSAPKSGI